MVGFGGDHVVFFRLLSHGCLMDGHLPMFVSRFLLLVACSKMRSLASYLAKIESSDALLSDSSIGIEIRRDGEEWRPVEVVGDIRRVGGASEGGIRLVQGFFCSNLVLWVPSGWHSSGWWRRCDPGS